MDLVPTEIQKLIISFMDIITKLNIRATSMHWFKMIDHRNFVFYFTRNSDLPAIAARLSQYQAPLALSFKKNFAITFEQFVNHITKLTSLTGLDMPQFHNQNLFGNQTGEQYHALTALTNLKRLKAPNPIRQMRFYQVKDICKNFCKLTSLEALYIEQIYGRSHHIMTELESLIKQNTELVELKVQLDNTTVDQRFADTFMNNRMLSRLSISATSMQYEACDLYRTLSNLKALSVSGSFAVGQLTNLEELEYHSSNPVPDIDKLEKLTKLSLRNGSSQIDAWSNLLRAVSNLTKLKSLSLSLNEAPDYGFLRSLTALEDLSISRDGHQPNQPIMEYFNSTHLTRLKIASLSQINFQGVSLPSSLLDLAISVKQEVVNSTLESLLGSATHLTKLCYASFEDQGNDVKVFEKMSNLRVLLLLTKHSSQFFSLKQMPQLESIGVNAFIDPVDFQYCSRLTALNCLLTQVPGTDYTSVPHLPLKCLSINHAITNKALLQTIGKFTAMQSLTLVGVKDEDVAHFTDLQQLTRLVVKNSESFTGKTLSPFTNMQVLETTYYRGGSNEKHVRALNLPYLYSIAHSYVDPFGTFIPTTANSTNFNDF